MSEADCGGCRGEGSHRRWCENAVGRSAAMMGRWSVQADALADSVGANLPEAANALYAASSMLEAEARRRATDWQSTQRPTS